MILSPQGRPLIFGEVLFDTFPDGARVLGGAPFNVAWHLQGFGADPLFVSAVGSDRQGEEIIQLMNAWGMDIRGVQIDAHHPTGVVAVTLADGQPAYDIVPHQAYDFITLAAAQDVTRQVEIALLYHGSLAIRNGTSRHTLQGLCEQLAVPRCIDINLRAPWWDREAIFDTVKDAYCVKLNDEELRDLTPPGAFPRDDLQRASRAFYEQSGIQVLVVTRGGQGALVITPDDVLSGAPEPLENVVDTVGAGDAFSAVVLLGLLRNWAWSDTLARALAFAAIICTVRGATLKDSAVYSDLLNAWGESADG